MRLAVDIDETLGTISGELGRLFTKGSASEYRYDGADAEFFRTHPGIYLRAVPYEGRAVALRGIAERHEVVYVTRRHRNALAVTYIWLLRNGFPLRRVYFTEDKGSLAERLGIDLAIDDAPDDILSYERHSVPCMVVRKPYNRDLGGSCRIW